MKLSIIILAFFFVNAHAQFLEDEVSIAQTTKGLDYLYNLQFESAERAFLPVKKKYNNHPVSHMIEALELQWQYLPIDKNPQALKKYIYALEQAASEARAYYKIPKYRKEAIFFLLASHGFIALAHNYNKEYLTAAGEAKKAHTYFTQGMKLKNESPEFMFASGVYNYYREQYPVTHPIVKPLLMFFEKGNKALGLRELEFAFNNSIFSRVESATYLSNINIKYESNFKKALYFSSDLYSKYPNNHIFTIKNIECLLLNNNFAAAAKLNNILSRKTDNVSTLSSLVFEAYINEHHQNAPNLALSQYAKALKLPMDDRYTREYHAMAYLGMARIFKSQNEFSKAKLFYKECLGITEYDWIIKAAKEEIKIL